MGMYELLIACKYINISTVEPHVYNHNPNLCIIVISKLVLINVYTFQHWEAAVCLATKMWHLPNATCSE